MARRRLGQGRGGRRTAPRKAHRGGENGPPKREVSHTGVKKADVKTRDAETHTCGVSEEKGPRRSKKGDATKEEVAHRESAGQGEKAARRPRAGATEGNAGGDNGRRTPKKGGVLGNG